MMKNIGFILTVMTFFCVSFFHPGALNAQKPVVTVPIRDGRYIQVQACEDQIFRIRVNSKDEFPQTLMERYGILKTDWDIVQTSVRKVKNTTVFQTSKIQLIINNETDDIMVKDHNGNVIIPVIGSFLNGSHPLFADLQKSLLDYSGKIAHGGGVIGDANYSGTKDSSRGADVISASVTEFGLTPAERFYGGGTTSGDNGGGINALYDQLNLGLSGFVNTSVDVEVGIGSMGGMHFGLFLPWVQVNSWYALLHPWYLTAAEKETFRFYDQLRYSLIPYIYSAALEGSQSGLPVLRPMPLEFPNDRGVDNMINQYMFGENLLVGVFNDSIYLPHGEWTNYWTGEKVFGPKKMRVTIPKNRGGHLFVRQGAIIPYQKEMQHVGERSLDTLIIKVFPHDNSTYTLWEDDGRSFEYETGKIMKTTFECNKTPIMTEFVINPAKGDYSGAFSSRTYSLEIVCSCKPSDVKVNGVSTEKWEYSDSGILTLTISQKDIFKKEVVTLLSK